ncbi:MAG: M20/M25/M40 family metallo-hydrolase, partial [Candidatus Eisenbacteria bacterium]
MSVPEPSGSAPTSFPGPLEARREPDWPDAVAECRTLLSELIAIESSNPPGRELDAARYLEARLAREGIQGRTFEAAPGRGNFVARLKGSGRKRPLILLGHLDVVGVQRRQWHGDPFQ